jgi:hypothetical protein
MERQGTHVGVDVSQARLDVALRSGVELFSEANDERAIARLVKRLKPLGCERIVVEATGACLARDQHLAAEAGLLPIDKNIRGFFRPLKLVAVFTVQFK